MFEFHFFFEPVVSCKYLKRQKMVNEFSDHSLSFVYLM